MVVDGILGFIVIWRLWKWDWWKAALLMVPLIFVDATFLAANLLKLLEGAWLPILFGIVTVLLIITWQRGSRILVQKTRRVEVPIDALIRSLEKKPPHIVPGTAVFLTSDPDFAPASLLHNLKHNKVLHEHNIILTIVTTDTPRTERGRARRDHAFLRALHPRRAAFRLHGGAERAESARARAQEGAALRHHVDVVLPVAPLAQGVGALGHAGVAGPAVHRARALRE